MFLPKGLDVLAGAIRVTVIFKVAVTFAMGNLVIWHVG
jgi:hypothetical protein